MQQQAAPGPAVSHQAPIPMECDAPFLKVAGELPRELNGTLYRNGPNPQFEVSGAHWFVGDGMLHAFHLENGRASYRNRWVRTPKWQAEPDAGRALFGGFGRKLPDAPDTITQDSGVANTNIIFHAGRLLALEEGHLPTEIEPGSLIGAAIAIMAAASPVRSRRVRRSIPRPARWCSSATMRQVR